jgi:hypothetical protein
MEVVRQRTGLDFDQGVLSAIHDPSAESGLGPNERIIAEVCFQEVFADIAAEVRRRNLDWRAIPGVLSHHESMTKSLEMWGSGQGKKLRLIPEARRIFKATFPGIEFKQDRNEGTGLRKSLTPDLEMVVLFQTDLGRMSKGFVLNLGLKGRSGPYAGLRWQDHLFRVFGLERNSACWTYTTPTELEAALRGVADLLSELLPLFEAAVLKYFSSSANEFPASILQRGPITARQGLKEARDAALAWARDATLIRIGPGGFLQVRDEIGPWTGPDGRLKSHGTWGYTFRSGSRKEQVTVEVPFAGRVRLSAFPIPDFIFLPTGTISPDDDWMDSDQAMKVAEEAGGRRIRANGKTNFHIGCDLRADSTEGRSSLRWEVSYLTYDKYGREDLTFSFNAEDGSDLHSTMH